MHLLIPTDFIKIIFLKKYVRSVQPGHNPTWVILMTHGRGSCVMAVRFVVNAGHVQNFF